MQSTFFPNKGKSLEQAVAIRVVGNTAPTGGIADGKYVFLKGHSTLPDGGYKANGAIQAGATLTSSNLTATSDGFVNDAYSALSSDLGSPSSASAVTGNDAFSKISTLNSKTPFPPYVAKGIMGSAEDFNNITTSGTYQSNGTGSNAHAPISGDDNGDLVVFGEHGRKLQLWVSAYNNKMLIRQQKNSTWSAWDELVLNSKFKYDTASGTTDSNGNIKVATSIRKIYNAVYYGYCCIPFYYAGETYIKVVGTGGSTLTVAANLTVNITYYYIDG